MKIWPVGFHCDMYCENAVNSNAKDILLIMIFNMTILTIYKE